MARPRQFAVAEIIDDVGASVPATLDADGICLAQTTGDAGPLALNGAAVSAGVYSAGFDGGRLITLTSTGNLSTITFSVTGTDKDGAAQNEDITGPNNNTVTGTKYFQTVTGISASDIVGTEVTAGFSSSLVVLNANSSDHFVLTPANAETYKVAIYGGASGKDRISLRINNPATSTVTWADGTTPSDTRIYFAAGTEPTLTASGIDWFDFAYDGNTVSGDTVWFCVNSAQDLKP